MKDYTAPYIVTADIRKLLKQWGMPLIGKQSFGRPPLKEGWHYYIPDRMFWKFRNDFRMIMEKMFPRFEFLPEEELQEGLSYLLTDSKADFTLSLDRTFGTTYEHNISSLQLNRVIDQNGRDIGHEPRPFEYDIPKQLDCLKGYYKRAKKDSRRGRFILHDDVIFSGSFMAHALKLLEERRMQVHAILAGVGTKEGCDRIRARGYPVTCVREYPRVIDVVCERDFYPGVPFSGRTLARQVNVGVPYLLPFGNPGKWASIPRPWQKPFSRFCIEQTIYLFEAIEKENEKKVFCKDLPRNVVGLPTDGTRYVDVLREVLKNL